MSEGAHFPWPSADTKGLALPGNPGYIFLPRRKATRRVLLERERTCVYSPAAYEAWLRRREHARLEETLHPICTLTDHGIEYRMPNPGEEVGYAMPPYGTANCLQAAIATATQIPIEEVIEIQVVERLTAGEHPDEVNRSSWERVGAWAEQHELIVHIHLEVPVRRHRWIGVITDIPSRPAVPVGPHYDGFYAHCVVMSHDRLIFDPAIGVEPPPGMRVKTYNPNAITYGITLDPKEQ